MDFSIEQRLLIFCLVFRVIFGNDQPNIIVILTDDQDVVLNGMVSLKIKWKFLNGADDRIIYLCISQSVLSFKAQFL